VALLPFKISFRSQRPKTRINETTTYELTPMGKTKAEQFSIDGPKGVVMEVLRANGPSTVGEIVQATGSSGMPLPREKVKRILGAYMHIYFERGKAFE
jgi:hypothetical protein